MGKNGTFEITLHDEAASSAFGARLGGCLRPGMVLLLEGPVGAGKSHLARAAIRARCGADTEVPSPTFTLVQTYEARDGAEIWHADLYRLTSPDEVEELGLIDAMRDAIVMIEWPDRLGSLVPPGAIRLALGTDGEGRRLTVTGADAGFAACMGWT